VATIEREGAGVRLRKVCDTVHDPLSRTRTETRNGVYMSSISIRRVVAAGLGVAVVLAFIPTVHSQRPVEPVASASSAAVRPADSPAVVPFKIQVPDAVLTEL
jgi:hypothetical protein